MTDVDKQRQEIAAAFGRDLDPLAQFAGGLESMDADLFELFIMEVLDTRDIAASTKRDYRRVFRQWREHMAEEGRHPACPSEEQVKSFIANQLGNGNSTGTVKNKVRKVSSAYNYWQSDAAFPHPQDFDPFKSAMDKVSFPSGAKKQPPKITISELRSVLEDVTNIRARAIIGLQFKLGLRRGEVRNIKLSEISLATREELPSRLGRDPRLADRPNAIYIPDDRSGNKSEHPRVLPLDDETRRILLHYLLIRPDSDEPWLFLTKQRHGKLGGKDINRIWESAFRPEYGETEDHAAITSHFGRHRFTTYWRVERDVNRELIKYMRGDSDGTAPIESRGAIDTYIHTYYEDVEDIYREGIYKLHL
jgi:integrase